MYNAIGFVIFSFVMLFCLSMAGHCIGLARQSRKR